MMVVARARPGFEQIPQAAMLRQDLLRAECHGALDRRRFGQRRNQRRSLETIGQAGDGRLDAETAGSDIQRLANRDPVEHQPNRRTRRAIDERAKPLRR